MMTPQQTGALAHLFPVDVLSFSFLFLLFFFLLLHFALLSSALALGSLVFSTDFGPHQAALFVAALINIFNILFSISGAGFCATNRRLLESGGLQAGPVCGCRRDDKGCGSRALPSAAVEGPGDVRQEGN